MTNPFRQVLEQSVVVFSQNYLPLCRVNIKRAIVLLVTEKAEPLDMLPEVGWMVHSPSLVLHVPKHIRLKIASSERTWKVPPVNRREVLKRDHHTCQYCGSSKHLTLDHVIPRSRGGLHTWDNVVTACERCNSKKGDKTLTEAGMYLRYKLKAPIHPTVAFAEKFWMDTPKSLE
ncbi:HNH endonuclease [Calothrix sp. NIES-4071]|nr:HNH endonuclease [Calothrix sp. NIES-4071]BAZ60964.1 HNH endonuclease [Calothrix sp. NIES-4105]